MKQYISVSIIVLLLIFPLFLSGDINKNPTDSIYIYNSSSVEFEKLTVFPVKPNYRGWMISDSNNEVRIFSNINEIRKKLNPENTIIEISLSLRNPVKKIYHCRYNLRTITEIITCPVPAITGSFDLAFTLVDIKKNKTLYKKIFLIELKNKNFQPHIYIDNYNRFIMDGKPFFPLGMYFASVFQEDIEIYSNSPFNCLMAYSINKGSLADIKARLDLIYKYNLYIIYSLKDIYPGLKTYPGQIGPFNSEIEIINGIVKEFSTHPAIFAWYLSDELWPKWLENAIIHHNIVHSIDQDHPTYTVLSKPDQVSKFIHSYDIIGTDSYPINRDAPDQPGKWAQITKTKTAGSRPMIQVLQAHNLEIYKKKKEYRPPTFDEINSMTWQSIINGANGILYYSFYDLKRDPDAAFEKRWADLLKVTQTVNEFIPVILSTEDPPVIKAKTSSAIEYMTKKYQGTSYIFTVNNSLKKSNIIFTCDTRYSRIRNHITKTEIIPEMNSFTVKMEPLEAAIYILIP